MSDFTVKLYKEDNKGKSQNPSPINFSEALKSPELTSKNSPSLRNMDQIDPGSANKINSIITQANPNGSIIDQTEEENYQIEM